MFVIPGCEPLRAGPESIRRSGAFWEGRRSNVANEYGFRARSQLALLTPRNDGLLCHPQQTPSMLTGAHITEQKPSDRELLNLLAFDRRNAPPSWQ
jgi:hypothetical protein